MQVYQTIDSIEMVNSTHYKCPRCGHPVKIHVQQESYVHSWALCKCGWNHSEVKNAKNGSD